MIDLSTVNLVDVARGFGVELKRQRSKRYVGLCPLHADSAPSFYVYRESPKDRFKCFGCGEYGDAIDFVRKAAGVSAGEAIKQLGVGEIKIRKHAKKDQDRKKTINEKFEAWRDTYLGECATLYNVCWRQVRKIKTPADLERYGDFYHLADYWRYHMEILTNGTPEEMASLYRSFYEQRG